MLLKYLLLTPKAESVTILTWCGTGMGNTDSLIKHRLTFTLLLVLLPTLILFHLFAAPYTKIEEAFHIQATHDILRYGLCTTPATTQFHHFTNLEPVPRTAVGAAILASVSQWALALREDIDHQFLGTIQ